MVIFNTGSVPFKTVRSLEIDPFELVSVAVCAHLHVMSVSLLKTLKQ